MPSLRTLKPARFLIARSLLFPGHRMTLETVLDHAVAVDAHLERIAAAHGATLIDQQRAWYGIDPVHIRRRWMRSAWSTVLDGWGVEGRRSKVEGSSAGASNSWRDGLRVRTAAPALRWIAGIEQRRAQPSARLADGTTIALY